MAVVGVGEAMLCLLLIWTRNARFVLTYVKVAMWRLFLQQFLQMMQGDEEEHAVLLTNYFLYLGKRAWLLLGYAIPERPTAYVLTDEGDDYWMWNASTGEHYSYQHLYCPVQSVGCLVDADNVKILT